MACGSFGPVRHRLSVTENISVESSEPGSDPPATITSILPLFRSTMAQCGASLKERVLRIDRSSISKMKDARLAYLRCVMGFWLLHLSL